MLYFLTASHASQGARRYQEDAAAVLPLATPAAPTEGSACLLAVLADGMGGHAGGAVASRIVCDTFLAAAAASAGSGCERLNAALEAANVAVAREVEREPRLSGMGSTITAALLGPSGLEWLSVGDSPLYLYRSGQIALLNEDHSLAPALDQMAADGRLSPAEARNDPRRHLLRSAVTGEEIDLVDVSRQPLVLQEGDLVVLASDGLNTLEPDEIARVLSAYAREGCAALAAALVRAVEHVRDPQQDNVTVVVVEPRASRATA